MEATTPQSSFFERRIRAIVRFFAGLLGPGMVKFLIQRILAAIPVLFALLLVTFVLIHLLPGGPFDAAGTRQRPEYMVRQLEQKFGLNKSLVFNTPNDGYYPDGDEWQIAGYRTETKVVSGGPGGEIQEVTTDVFRIDLLDSQFFNYFWGVLQLDLGPSLNRQLINQNVMVQDEITAKLPVSARVGVMAVVLGFLLGIPLGVVAAVYHNTPVDYGTMFFAVLNQATPSIVLGPVLIIVFAVELNWVPVVDSSGQWQDGPFFSLYDLHGTWRFVQIAALPVITLGTGMSAGIARLTRASLLQVMHEDYVRTARSKGMRERGVVYVHALKNALIPVATIIGPLLASLLTGTFVVEKIFSIPGLGDAFIKGVEARDYSMIMGITLLYSTFLIIGNILVDVIYTWLDPRIRFD